MLQLCATAGRRVMEGTQPPVVVKNKKKVVTIDESQKQ